MQQNKLRKKENENLSFGASVKRCAAFIPVFCIITIICTTFLAFLFYNLSDPSSMSSLCAELSLCISFIISTCFLLKGTGDGKILIGFIYGAVLLLILYCLSLAFGEGFSSAIKIVLRASMPFFGAIIGILFTKSKVKKGKKRRRRA